MTFLPVVERELRVASRKRSTFWLRVVAALVALIIGTGFLILSTASRGFGFGAPDLGKGLFAVLTWLSLAAALAAGLFFTSDCLSEEKREGTLGFLFLTDLRGYDVVLGKLLATSLRTFYALLAVFPVFAIPLLMGGVAGGQFWKTLLALMNALFMSLAAGLFVSTINRDSQKALGATLILLLLLAAGGPAVDSTFAVIGRRTFNPIASLSSPGYLFVAADNSSQLPFWAALLTNQAVGWTLLGLACLLLPRSWQERTKTDGRNASWAKAPKFGDGKRGAIRRGKLLDLNPVLWLASRHRWQMIPVWAVAILLLGGFIAMYARNRLSGAWFLWSYLGNALMLLLYLAIASQAGRFFVEAKRNGLLELLLATPLTVRQMIHGQWNALLRLFGVPLTVCMVAQICGAFLAQQMTWRQISGVTPVTTVVATNSTRGPTNTRMTTTVSVGTTKTTTISVGAFTAPGAFVALAISIAAALAVAGNLIALAWFGMWMGLNSNNTPMATLKTIAFVQIIPWFVVTFASALLVPFLFYSSKGTMVWGSQMFIWYPLLTSGLGIVLALTKDVIFVLWSRRSLYSEVRARALPTIAPIWPIQPPPLPPIISSPTDLQV